MAFQSEGRPLGATRSAYLLLGGLGYLVDVLDIQLFAILRVRSLVDLHVEFGRIAAVSGYILNAQMVGMLFGSFFWGMVADRFGRVRSLCGSVLVFSIATVGCALVWDPWTYGIARFLAGFGLAGETGAATTLIAELSTTQRRGWNVAIIGALGFLGPAFAILLSTLVNWRWAYVVAGMCGLLLLALRRNLGEAAIFEKLTPNAGWLTSIALVYRRKNLPTILRCLALGVPLVYCWNILNFYSLELSRFTVASSVHFDQLLCLGGFFLGTSCGDLISGACTSIIGSRIRTFYAFLMSGLVISVLYLALGSYLGLAPAVVYVIYFVLGITGGCWVLMTTVFAELFGTNARATASITLTNIVRSLIVPLTLCMNLLLLRCSLVQSVLILGITAYGIGLFALVGMEETYDKDLDFAEAEKA